MIANLNDGFIMCFLIISSVDGVGAAENCWQRGWKARDIRDILWEFGAGTRSWKKQRAQTQVISPKWWNRQGGVGSAVWRRALQGSFAPS